MPGLDLSQVTLLKSVASLLGLVVLALVWRGLCTFADEMIKRAMPKRRIGNRTTDDTKPSANGGLEWYDRLIEAMSANADVNQEVAKTLQMLVARQDTILESFRMSQLQQHEALDQGKTILALLRGRTQEA